MVENDNKPQKTEVTVEYTEVKELQDALKKEYRTDHLTLPVVGISSNPERDKASDLERKIILDPDLKDETVVDDKGTTVKEWRDRLERGIMPKDAPKGALKGVGKHKVEVGGTKADPTVIITSPVTKDEVVIATPDLKDGKTPFGMELIHDTSPVPEILDSTKAEDLKKDNK
jgi:hypothetical protein